MAVPADLYRAMPALDRAEPLAEAVDASLPSRLPLISDLDPYTVGTNPSACGDATSYGQRDPYVARAADELLRAALLPGRLVVVAGPVVVGKTRTAFEVAREHKDWSGALLAAPAPRSIGELAEHPDMGGNRPLVIWLDDLPRFLPPTGTLSNAAVSRLAKRPGPVLLLATMRASQRDVLWRRDVSLTQEARLVLGGATWIELASTREDPAEQARAASTYPQVSTGREGLAETLVSAPELLRRYRDAAVSASPLRLVVQVCVDWARCGMGRPIPEPDLRDLARWAAKSHGYEISDKELDGALSQACAPGAEQGDATLLVSRQLQGGFRGYMASGFLAAVDDGEVDGRTRRVTRVTWQRVLDRASAEEALGVGVAAYLDDNIPVAVSASRKAAAEGYGEAQFSLAVLLAECLNPPDLAGARSWYIKAAEAGDAAAQFRLGTLLADRMNPPDLAAARRWWTAAAEAGNTEAQFTLGMLLAERLDPPDLARARRGRKRAAQDAGAEGSC